MIITFLNSIYWKWVSGLTAALSAAHAGAKVILLDKNKTYTARGGDNAAIGSRLQKQLGIEIDIEEVIRALLKWGGNKPDARLIRLWAENCGNVMNWIMDMTDAAGLRTNIYIPTSPGADAALIDKWPNPTGFPSGWNYRMENYVEYPTSHRWNNGTNQRFMLGILESNALKSGVGIRYNTRADRLTAIDKSPYCAGWSGNPSFLGVMGGLVVNLKLQPVDTQGNIIPGLYLAGNTVGRRFANEHPLMVPGLRPGRFQILYLRYAVRPGGLDRPRQRTRQTGVAVRYSNKGTGRRERIGSRSPEPIIVQPQNYVQ